MVGGALPHPHSPWPSNFWEHSVLSASPPSIPSVLVLLTSCTHGREIRGDSRGQSVGTGTDAVGAAPGLRLLWSLRRCPGGSGMSEASGFLCHRPPPRVWERKRGSDQPGHRFGPRQALGRLCATRTQGQGLSGTKIAGPSQSAIRDPKLGPLDPH